MVAKVLPRRVKSPTGLLHSSLEERASSLGRRTKTLSRYIGREATKLLLLWAFAFFMIFFVIELFERMNVIIINKAPFLVILEYFFYKIPPFLSQTLPFATLLASLITLGVLARNNEIIAMKAHGVSIYRIMLPLFALAVIVTVFIFILNETVVPYATRKASYCWSVKVKKEEERAFFRLNKIWYRGDEAIYNIRLLDPKKDILQGVTIYYFGPSFSLLRRVDAREAHWKGDGWTFYQVTVRSFAPGGEINMETYAEMDIPIPERPEDFKKGVHDPMEMTYAELRDYVERIKGEGYDPTRYVVELHKKISFPLLTLIMVLMGSPLTLAASHGRGGGITLGVGISIAIGFVYWVFFAISVAMGYAGTLPPLLAAWAPNILFALIGGFIMESVHQ